MGNPLYVVYVKTTPHLEGPFGIKCRVSIIWSRQVHRPTRRQSQCILPRIRTWHTASTLVQWTFFYSNTAFIYLDCISYPESTTSRADKHKNPKIIRSIRSTVLHIYRCPRPQTFVPSSDLHNEVFYIVDKGRVCLSANI